MAKKVEAMTEPKLYDAVVEALSKARLGKAYVPYTTEDLGKLLRSKGLKFSDKLLKTVRDKAVAKKVISKTKEGFVFVPKNKQVVKPTEENKASKPKAEKETVKKCGIEKVCKYISKLREAMRNAKTFDEFSFAYYAMKDAQLESAWEHLVEARKNKGKALLLEAQCPETESALEILDEAGLVEEDVTTNLWIG